MFFKYNFKSFFNNHKLDILCLLFLITFISILTYFLLQIDMKLGVYYVRDVFSYLNNALRFAGFSAGLENMKGLSPLVPFLTSILFRMGFVHDWAIMIVSGLFYILSGIGMYFFLRLRFKEVFSCCGAIILATFSINLAWASKGMLDIPGMALSIWAVYFMIVGVKKNTKFFYLAFPTLILGFFARYTVIFTLPVMLIVILFLENPFNYIKKHFKNLFGGVIAGLLTTLPFLLYYYLYNIPLFFLSQTQAISSETAGNVVNSGTVAKTSIFYYLNNLPIYLSTDKFPPYSLKPGKYLFDKLMWIGGEPSFIGYLFLGILIIGSFIYIYNIFKKSNRNLILNKKDIHNKRFYFKTIFFIIFSSLFILTFNKISVIYSLIIFSVATLILYRILYNVDIKNFKLDFLVLYWFMTNLIFFSSHLMKVGRYFITLTPPIAYFIILSIYLILEKIRSNNISKSDLNKEGTESRNVNNLDLINMDLTSIKLNKSDSKDLTMKSRFKLNKLSLNNFNKLKLAIPILLIAILTIFTVTCFLNEPITYDNQKPSDILYGSQNEKNIANWIMINDPNYESKVIWADRGGDFSFYLRKSVSSVDHLSKQSDFTLELLNNNITYFISKGQNNNISKDYTLVKYSGNVYLYKRSNS